MTAGRGVETALAALEGRAAAALSRRKAPGCWPPAPVTMLWGRRSYGTSFISIDPARFPIDPQWKSHAWVCQRDWPLCHGCADATIGLDASLRSLGMARAEHSGHSGRAGIEFLQRAG